MTLHETTEQLKKGIIASGFGLTGIIILVIIFRIGIAIKNIIFPPKIEPANHAYGKLPPLAFPAPAVKGRFTYTLEGTETGTLPQLPDRLNVYPIINPPPALLNLDKARTKAASFGFVTDAGLTIPDIELGNANYSWTETKENTLSGLTRRLIFNIITFDFTVTSNYITSLNVLHAQHLSDQNAAIDKVASTLTTLELLPNDLDIDKIRNPDASIDYYTGPQLFSIVNSTSQLSPATSLNNAQIIRVDLYQKDIEYDLDTGITGEDGVIKQVHMKVPVVYPHPPYSTMTFWLGSGKQEPEIVQADYSHKDYVVPQDQEVTYPLKSAQAAYNELQQGQAYIAAYNGTDSQILIKNIYLAYYMGRDKQYYVMPVIVFEGDKGFIAYVSAVDNAWIQDVGEAPNIQTVSIPPTGP